MLRNKANNENIYWWDTAFEIQYEVHLTHCSYYSLWWGLILWASQYLRHTSVCGRTVYERRNIKDLEGSTLVFSQSDWGKLCETSHTNAFSRLDSSRALPVYEFRALPLYMPVRPFIHVTVFWNFCHFPLIKDQEGSLSLISPPETKFINHLYILEMHSSILRFPLTAFINLFHSLITPQEWITIAKWTFLAKQFCDASWLLRLQLASHLIVRNRLG